MKESSKFIDIKFVNKEIKDIKALFKKEITFEEGKRRFLILHSYFYKAEMSKRKDSTFEDILWDNLNEQVLRTSVNEKVRTIVYGFCSK